MSQPRSLPLSLHMFLAGAAQPRLLWLLAILLGVFIARLPLPVAAALVFGAAAFLLVLIEPLLGLGLALLTGPFGALESLILPGLPLDSGQLLLLLTFAAWMGQGMLNRRILLPRTALSVPLLSFLFVAALTLTSAPSLAFGMKELLKWIEVLLVMLLVVDRAGGRQPSAGAAGRVNGVGFVLAILLLAGLSQAAVGIWQFGLRGDGPEHFLILGHFYRAYGTFEQPNPFGGFMNLSALLALGTLLGSVTATWFRWRARKQEAARPGRWTAGWSVLILTAGTAAATGLGLLFSWSRGAWLGFAAGITALVFVWPRKRRYGLLALLLGAGVALMLLAAGVRWHLLSDEVLDRITGFSEDLRFGDVRGVDINDANYAVLERLAHWQAALDMARDHLWLGVGFGNYEPAYADYALINWPDPLGHAHNYYLNILAETGMLGLVAYLIFWTAVLRQLMKQLQGLGWPRRGIAMGLLAAWIALSIHHLVDKLYVNNIYIHIGAMLGLQQILEQEEVEIHE